MSKRLFPRERRDRVPVPLESGDARLKTRLRVSYQRGNKHDILVLLSTASKSDDTYNAGREG
jgi:hypothetical protein